VAYTHARHRGGARGSALVLFLFLPRAALLSLSPFAVRDFASLLSRVFPRVCANGIDNETIIIHIVLWKFPVATSLRTSLARSLKRYGTAIVSPVRR
jgi:hypothetical protein